MSEDHEYELLARLDKISDRLDKISDQLGFLATGLVAVAFLLGGAILTILAK